MKLVEFYMTEIRCEVGEIPLIHDFLAFLHK